MLYSVEVFMRNHVTRIDKLIVLRDVMAGKYCGGLGGFQYVNLE